jgi:hypothetical protein
VTLRGLVRKGALQSTSAFSVLFAKDLELINPYRVFTKPRQGKTYELHLCSVAGQGKPGRTHRIRGTP